MADPRQDPDEKSPAFDAILAELEQVVATLERGDLPLEEALTAFERGIALTRQGERILGEAERRVEVLLQSRDGEAVLERMDQEPAQQEPEEP